MPRAINGGLRANGANTGERHDRPHAPHHACGRCRRCRRTARRTVVRRRRRAAGRQAGAELLSLQDRGLRADDHSGRRAPSEARREPDPQRQARGRAGGAGRELPAERPGRLLLPSDRCEHRLEARAHRHRQRTRKHPDRHRDDPRQSRRRRHRSEDHRHRRDLAFPRRPHQRAAHRRRRARLSQCRDQGAGKGVGVLDRRGQRQSRAARASSRPSRTPSASSARSPTR